MRNVAQVIERIRNIARVAAKLDSALDELHGINRDLGVRLGTPGCMLRFYDNCEQSCLTCIYMYNKKTAPASREPSSFWRQ